ncbi:hypothetical protein EYF80_020364 [Liparis tanakae]|uniref:Uncharacterized protein n=1 Tax=Liparis tanakae TaxID=230148 RepID=A0A4Z2HWL0_9TELE|nr:hypothetical protein EYF80_020364 [Liparis tanakae]
MKTTRRQKPERLRERQCASSVHMAVTTQACPGAHAMPCSAHVDRLFPALSGLHVLLSQKLKSFKQLVRKKVENHQGKR